MLSNIGLFKFSIVLTIHISKSLQLHSSPIQCQSQGTVLVWKKGQGSNLPGQNEKSFPFPVKSKKQNEESFPFPVKSKKQKLNVISNYMFNKRVNFKNIHFSNPNQDLSKLLFDWPAMDSFS